MHSSFAFNVSMRRYTQAFLTGSLTDTTVPKFDGA